MNILVRSPSWKHTCLEKAVAIVILHGPAHAPQLSTMEPRAKQWPYVYAKRWQEGGSPSLYKMDNVSRVVRTGGVLNAQGCFLQISADRILAWLVLGNYCQKWLLFFVSLYESVPFQFVPEYTNCIFFSSSILVKLRAHTVCTPTLLLHFSATSFV